MRYLTLAAALLTIAVPAVAQDASIPDPMFVNQIDLGLRGTIFGAGSDEARFQRYRDLRNGGLVDRFRIAGDSDVSRYHVHAEHVGYRDQRYAASYQNFGRLKAEVEWNQIPLFYSGDTRTLYDVSVPGQLTIDDRVQSGIQNKTLTLATALTGASLFDLRTRRDVASAVLTYSATPSIDLAVTFRNTQKTGAYPWGGSFGLSNSTELPVPVDHRTTDIGTSVEYAGDRGFARIGYDGSFFRNSVTTLTWDNPSRVADSATLGPAMGRMALWPDTEMHTVTAAGGFNLPGRSHVTAFGSVASLSNDNLLLPYTVNSALVSPALDRLSSDVKATVTSINVALTSRPATAFWYSLRYRQYEFDNKTVPFRTANSVNYDTAIVALNAASEPFGSIRHTFDADASFTPVRYLGLRAGYSREQVDRTYRIVEQTTEDTARASVDLTGLGWLTVRGVFEHGRRTGSAVNGLELLAIGEQPLLRQYDISDRNQDRFNAIVQITPASQVSVNASAGVGRQDYPGTTFGLRNNDNQVYSLGFDYVPSEKVSLGASYGHERYSALQASRTANPLPANTLAFLNDPAQQFNDPRRDWTDDSADTVRTITASLDVIKLLPKIDVKLAYDYSRAQSTYTYGLAADTVVAGPVPLTPVINQLRRGTIDGRYFVSPRTAVGIVYWYDDYKVDDFALGPVASLAQPATAAPTLVLLGYFYRPYTAHSVTLRFTYLW
ncbi:MAG: decaheme-associated outer membrane protein MtrB/PioB family [Acidobacteria bacterium]|nr:decaheme-associated outer membrane protein MtrB/PioB family [Acidobacteriota bacterium]